MKELLMQEMYWFAKLFVLTGLVSKITLYLLFKTRRSRISRIFYYSYINLVCTEDPMRRRIKVAQNWISVSLTVLLLMVVALHLTGIF